FRRLRLSAAAQWVLLRTQGSPGLGQSQHSYARELRRSARCEDGRYTAAEDRIPLHAKACELAEYGRDRDRCSAAPVPGALCCRASYPYRRGGGLAEAAQRRSMRHRLELYAPGRRSKVEPPLCFVINVSLY